MGTAVGPAVGHDLVPVTGAVPARVGRPAGRGRRRPRLRGDWPGFQAEGLVYDAGRHAAEGPQPAQPVRAGRPTRPRAASRSRCYVEAAANPDILDDGFAPDPARRPADRRRRAALPAAPAPTSPCSTRTVWQLRPGPRGAARADARAGRRTSRAATRSCAPSSGRSTPSTSTTSPAPRRAARARAGRRAGRARRTPAPTASRAVGHAHIDSAWLWPVRETMRKVARTFANVTALAGRRTPSSSSPARQAQQYAWMQGALPGAVRARSSRRSPTGSSCRSAGCGSRPTPTCPAARRWPGSSCTASGSSSTSSASRPRRSGCPTRSATPARLPADRPAGRRRAGSSPRRSPGTRPTSSRTTPSGGRASTAPGSSPTSRRSTPTTPSCQRRASWPTRRATTATRARPPARCVPFGYGDGGGGPTREMLARARRLARPGGLAAGRDRARPTDVLRRGRGGVRRRAGLGRRAVPGAAPRHLHHARPRPSRATGAASTCCARPSCGAATAAVRTGLRATRTSELDRLWKMVLLHQFHDILPGLARSPGCTARPRRRTRGSPAELEAIIDAALGGAAPATADGAAWSFNAAPHDRGRRCRRVGAGARPRRGRRRADAGGRAGRRRGRAAARVLDNGLLRVERRRATGLLTSVLDLAAGREVLAAGQPGNLLQLHPDLPNQLGRLGHRRATTATASPT